MYQNSDELTRHVVRIAAKPTASTTFRLAEDPPNVDYGDSVTDGSKLVKALAKELERAFRTLDGAKFPKGALTIRLEAPCTWTSRLKIPETISPTQVDVIVRSFMAQTMAEGSAPPVSADECAMLPQATRDQIHTSALHIRRTRPRQPGTAAGFVDCSFQYPGQDLLVVHGPLGAAPDPSELHVKNGEVVGTIDGERLSERTLWIVHMDGKTYTSVRFEQDELLQEAKALACLGPVRFFFERTYPNGNELLSLMRSERA